MAFFFYQLSILNVKKNSIGLGMSLILGSCAVFEDKFHLRNKTLTKGIFCDFEIMSPLYRRLQFLIFIYIYIYIRLKIKPNSVRIRF
jgi:hypothetical protein